MMEDNMISSQASTQGLRDTQDLHCDPDPSWPSNHQPQAVWGRLFPIHEQFTSYNLTKSSNTFGRGNTDFRFTSDNCEHALLPFISSVHFRIQLEVKQDSEPLVIIEDLSLNGIYINGERVEKDRKFVLQNNCEISVAHPDKKVFVFYDCLKNDDQEYPRELTQAYTVTKKLGEGNFGEVRLAYKQGSLEKCAVKILKKKGTFMALNNLKQITNEIDLLKSVNHPCIIHFKDVIDTPEKIFILMEAAGGGELFDRLVSSEGLRETTVKFYFYQLALAVDYLHSRKITHRDIKPENILLATTEEFTTIKLTDFGLSKLALDASQMTTFCGTITYIAPELLDIATLSYTKKVDLWSLGVVLYVSFAAYSPFHGTDLEVKRKILEARYSFRGKVWDEVSGEAKDLIARLLVRDPVQRLDAATALQHPWLADEEMRRKVEELLQQGQVSPVKKRLLEEDSGLGDMHCPATKTPKLHHGINHVI